MAEWDADLYLQFESFRMQPGLDLLHRIDLDAPERIVDLGCGTGHLTLALADRWPHAQVAGIDSSDAMLAKAAELDTAAHVSWLPGDIRTWTAAHRVDLVYANASLHWVVERGSEPGHDHPRLLHHLLGQLNPGGVLAFQVPDNFTEPSHTVAREVVAEGPWAARLRPLLLDRPVLPPERYHRLLAPVASRLDVWQTTYWHALTGEDPVLRWISGTYLRDVLAELREGEERDRFRSLVADGLRRAYPPDESGVTFLPFQRLFVVAQRR